MGRCSVNTTLGTFLIEFDGAGICKLALPSSREDNLCSATEIKGQCDLDRNISLASRLLERYFLGEEVDFGPVEISIDSQSSFYRKVYGNKPYTTFDPLSPCSRCQWRFNRLFSRRWYQNKGRVVADGRGGI
jgi:hypothetical protein